MFHATVSEQTPDTPVCATEIPPFKLVRLVMTFNQSDSSFEVKSYNTACQFK